MMEADIPLRLFHTSILVITIVFELMVYCLKVMLVLVLPKLFRIWEFWVDCGVKMMP